MRHLSPLSAIFTAFALLTGSVAARGQVKPVHNLWLEAETFGPLVGSNFSFQPVEKTTKGSWSLSGPGVAAEWTQGGESEFMSIAARADEPAEVSVGRDAVAPAAGRYTLWVRYADYRNKSESFGVRVRQGGKTTPRLFGAKPVVDELDPMKLRWDWAFGWDRAEVDLVKGPVRVEIFTTGPAEARRQVDCLCLTTDAAYHPFGREKPDEPIWAILRAMQRAGMSDVEPLASAGALDPLPGKWNIATGPPHFLWNTGDPWVSDLKKPAAERVEAAFGLDGPMQAAFIEKYKGKEIKEIPIFGHPLSGPVFHIPIYPAVFANASPVLDWLGRHPERKFGILLNYADPAWPAGADRKAPYANLLSQGERFLGYVAGENISYDNPDVADLQSKIKAARTRGEILTAMRDAHALATGKKFSDYASKTLTPAEVWAPVIPCLSANNEAFAHALANWGVRRVGHEGSANAPVLARRLAFLRGAARQFGTKIVDYQSCNFGDASTIFSRQASFYPATPRYVLDNQYDLWAGAGLNWVLKDYLLFHLAGCDAFYHEEGNDLFWKPGGNSAGDDFPLELSPRGRVTEAFLKVAADHPRGTQYTPIAFLMDEAHGYAQERFNPGAFGEDPQLNPALLTPGRHEANIRGWFDIAYYPAPETQNEPASSIRQTYVNGIFGDIFDVVVTAARRAEIVKTYPVLITAGEVSLTEEWGTALNDYLQAGGTLVACAGQFSGPGAALLKLPNPGEEAEADRFTWKLGDQKVVSNVFHYRTLPAENARVLAEAGGAPIATIAKRGKGQLVFVSVPLGLGLDDRPVPVLALVMRHLAQGPVPLKVSGDVEWTLNRLDDGGWLVALLNNRGVNKPQHGVNPTALAEAQEVTLTVPYVVAKSSEWMTTTDLPLRAVGSGMSTTLTVPAGAVRLIEVHGR